MQLSQLLTPELILAPLDCDTDDQALECLVQQLAPHAGLSSTELLQLLTEDAALRGSLIGHGAAIVHSRVASLKAPLAAMGIAPRNRSYQFGGGVPHGGRCPVPGPLSA